MDESNSRVWKFVGVLTVLALVYVVFFTDLIFPPRLAIEAEQLHVMAGERPNSIPLPIFAIDHRCRLSEVRVVRLTDTGDDQETVWHVVGATRSAPVSTFVYGASIDGMRPAEAGTRRTRLEFGARYRVEVRSGRRYGHLEFDTPAPPQPRAQASTLRSGA